MIYSDKFGTPGRTRTCDLELRVSCSTPTELRGRNVGIYRSCPVTYNSGMQSGPIVHNRLLPKIAASYCERTGTSFKSLSEDWILRLSKGGITKWVVGYQFDLNGAAASDLAHDKVATFLILDAAGVETIPHYLVRVLPEETLYGGDIHSLLRDERVVAKPLDGMGGRDVDLFDSVDTAHIAMIQASHEPAWALSPFRELTAEYRLLLLDGKLLLAFEKTKPAVSEWAQIINLGAGAEPADVSPETLQQLLPIAERAMQAATLRLAAVDIVREADGTLCIIEMNCGVSLEHYARQSDEYLARATAAYQEIIDAMFH